MFLVSEEGKDEEQVLKDHWVDEGRSFELFISEETLEYLRKYCGEDAAQLVERQFSPIVKEISVKVGDQDDHTLNVTMRASLPVAIGKEDLTLSGQMSEGLRSLDCVGKIAHAIVHWAQDRPTSLHRKSIRRMVNEEYGTPKDKVKRMSEATVVLRAVSEGTVLCTTSLI